MLYPLLLALVVTLGPDDARDAVAKLVSQRSAEREAAEHTLENLGEAALDALGEAADSRDLELRLKAAALLDSIEGRRITRPTLVPLDFQAKPLSEVVQAIGRSAGVTAVLEPEGDPRGRAKTVTLKSTMPVPFWDAIDRVAREGGLRLDPSSNSGFRQRQMMGMNGPARRRRVIVGNELVLRFEEGGNPPAPASDSGALRVTVGSLVLNRSRSFVRTAENVGQPETTALFMLGLQVRAEPRLTIASLDDPRLIEARDDRGQSLLAGPDGVGATSEQRPGRRVEPFIRNQPLMFTLKYPEMPGQTIARLRGTLRALVIGRRSDALAIPLRDATGKSFTAGSASIFVHAVRTSPDGRDTTVEFTLDTAGGGAGSQPIFNPLDPRAGLRPPPAARGQMDFLDARGQVCHSVDLANLGMGYGSGGRTTVIFQPAEGTGPPTEARFYAATWATVAVAFEFRDVPMP
jgi:hypothetical protein